MRRACAAIFGVLAWLGTSPSIAASAETVTLFDTARSRAIPIAVYRPAEDAACLAQRDCPVAFISPGYEGSAEAYTFLARALNRMGYLVIGIQLDLPTDAPMALNGDIQTIRSPYWRQGTASIAFLLRELPARYVGANWARVVLIGHSNGGDISALFAQMQPERVAALVTLDHRRVALPKTARPRTLSIRSADQQADPGVLPSAEEQTMSTTCIVSIAGALHNDMHDGGPPELRRHIETVVVSFLRDFACRQP